MTNPTPEQIQAAAKAMGNASSGFFSEGSWRHLAREALVAAAGVTPQEPAVGPVGFSIENGWLVESVGEHTCGAGMDGYGHEAGCGYVPVLNLAELDGYPSQVDEAKLAEIVRRVDSHEWSRMGGSQGEQVADIVRDVLGGGGE